MSSCRQRLLDERDAPQAPPLIGGNVEAALETLSEFDNDEEHGASPNVGEPTVFVTTKFVFDGLTDYK